MKTEQPLQPRIDTFISDLERYLLEQDGDRALLAREASELAGISKAANPKLSGILEALHETVAEGTVGAGDTPADLLPLVFQLRDLIGGLELVEAEETRGPFLEIDLHEEIARVFSVDEERHRLLNAALRAGQSMYLLVLRCAPDYLDGVEAALEEQLQVLRMERQDRTSRLTVLVVEAVEPSVEALISERFNGAEAVRDFTVRPVMPAELNRQLSIDHGWYRTLPPLSMHTDQSTLERIWVILDQTDPEQLGRGQRSLWGELRADLVGALSVDLRELLSGMVGALTSMAVERNRQVRITFQGDAGTVGAEIAEPLREALFEVFANAIIHGIEPAEERLAAGKDPAGEIRCTAHNSSEGLTIRIHDDGRGVDEQMVRHAGGRSGSGKRPSSGLPKARSTLVDRLGGVLKLKSGARGATVVVQLPAVRGVYRAVRFRRLDVELSVPAAIVEWAEPVAEHRSVRDRAGARYLRYQRQLVPLVEPVYSWEGDEHGLRGGGDVRNAPPAAVVLRVGGAILALAADSIGESVVITGGDANSVRPVVLQALPL